MKRLVISLFLLGLVALMAGPVYAGEGDDVPRNLRIAITPFSGKAGDTISVSGSGADPSQPVVVTLSPRADTAEGAFATATVTPAADGAFSATLTVPSDIADGRYYVRGEQFTASGEAMHYYYNTFTIGQVGTLLPVTGVVPGTSLTVTATLALLLALSMLVRGLYAIMVR